MRTKALVHAARSLAPTDVLSVSHLRAGNDCEKQCAACDGVLVGDGPGPAVRSPVNWEFCARAALRLEEVLRRGRYDAVLVSDIQLHQYALRARPYAQRLLMDLHNAESALQADLSAHPELRRLSRAPDASVPRLLTAERALLRQADLVTVPSRLARDQLAAGLPDTFHKISVVPNAVRMSAPRPASLARPTRCLFVGVLSYLPNTLAALSVCRDIAPAVRRVADGMSVVIAGKDPPDELLRAAAEAGVEVIADPPDIRPLYRESVLLVPLTMGGGTRLKILEAFSAGCSVLSTAKGIEGIDAVPGRHYQPAEDAPSFAAALQDILRMPQADLERRQNAWDLVRDGYSWEAVEKMLAGALHTTGLTF